MSDTEIPFSEALDELLHAEQLPLSLLYRLSDLSEADMAHFDLHWPEASEERRRIIIRHLADISEDDYVVDFAPIFLRCMSDAHVPVRIAALDGVWDSTSTSFIAPIVAMLQGDEDLQVRAAAAGALAHFVLLAEWGQISKAVLPPLVDALLAEYDRPDTAPNVRRALLEALGAASHPRVEGLISDAYESEDPDLQMSALFAMGSSADERWIPIVVAEMGSEVAEMRQEAARAAGGIGDPSVIAELADLTMDENHDVAVAGVVALGQIGGEVASRILHQLMEDPEADHLREAVEEAVEELQWLDGGLELFATTDDDEFEDD